MKERVKLYSNFKLNLEDSTESNDNYIFGGHVITYESTLRGHFMHEPDFKLQVSKDAGVNYFKDDNDSINVPLTIDHSRTVDNTVGKFTAIRTDDKGVYGTATIPLVTNKLREIAGKIKAGILTNFSSEISITEYFKDQKNKVEYISNFDLSAVSIVAVPADPKATVKQFAFTDETQIKDFSNLLRNLGMTNKEANVFISNFKQFLAKNDNSQELHNIKLELERAKQDIQKYKLLTEL